MSEYYGGDEYEKAKLRIERNQLEDELRSIAIALQIVSDRVAMKCYDGKTLEYVVKDTLKNIKDVPPHLCLHIQYHFPVLWRQLNRDVDWA